MGPNITQGHSRLRRLGCRHKYLPWILVSLDHDNETRCAFPYGSRKGSIEISRRWEKADRPKVGSNLSVWVLRSPGECIVGFDEPSKMSKQLSNNAWGNYFISLILALLACLSLSGR